ncbi:MAG: PIN domain-containing protein [Opitutaceae bacterium]|jgi:toxin-antitoxin system PIN domain toxin|nr:PIN domain-containing protein [Opitutaceae bacterium]
MTSLDANILLYAYSSASPWHEAAADFVTGATARTDFALSELVLVELYTLLRNPSVLASPLTAKAAVGVIEQWRQHPRWQLLGFPADSVRLHEELWRQAAAPQFARRRIYDVRLAFTLRQQGVTQFATANVKDFSGLGFSRVWNPCEVNT